MEVPENSEGRTIECYRCFAVIPAGSPYCPECGVSIADAEGSDVAVYQDLAKANLERRRGNFKAAIDACLGILRNYPNNVTAHSLLGEIYMEQGDLPQAAEWLEMAVDLEPRAHREQAMLKQVREQMARQEVDSTVEQLKIQPRSGITAYAAGMVVLVLAVAAGAFFIGTRSAARKLADIPAQPIVVPAKESPEQNPAPTSIEPTAPAPTAAIRDDETLMEQIRNSGQKSSLIRSAVTLPNSNAVVVTADTESGVALGETALLIASDVFTAQATLARITIRLVQGGSLAFSATVTRDVYDEAQRLSADGNIAEAARLAFDGAWYRDAESAPGSPVKPPEAGPNSAGPTQGPGGE